MLSVERLSSIRLVVLGLTGLVCALYASLALLWGNPVPFAPWVPGLCGLASAIIISLAACAAGDRTADMAFDEGYAADNQRAQRYGYWIAVFLYPAFAVPLSLGWITWQVGFAAMGTLTAAGYLLLFVLFDLQGRRETGD